MCALCQDADIRDEKLAVEEKLSLESTKPWVTCPEAVLLTYNGRLFEIGVDPTALSPGVHYAEVYGSDVKSPWRGPLFRVPITVCIPTEVSGMVCMPTESRKFHCMDGSKICANT